MTKKTLRNFLLTGSLFVLFVAYTIIIKFVEVRAVGQGGVEVGLATINQWFFNLLGVVDVLDIITDVLAGLAFVVAGIYVVVGIYQLFTRKSLKKVDKEIQILAIIYVLLVCCFLFFEFVVINNRPILVDGEIEASYPSTHSLLVCTILGCAIVTICQREKRKKWKGALLTIACGLSVIAVVCRLLSGQHWLTDIVGGVLLSSVLVMLYYSCVTYEKRRVEIVEESTMQDITPDGESL